MSYMVHLLLLALFLGGCAPAHTTFIYRNDVSLVWRGRIWTLPFEIRPDFGRDPLHPSSELDDWAVDAALIEGIRVSLATTFGCDVPILFPQTVLVGGEIGPVWRASLVLENGVEAEIAVLCSPQDHLCVAFAEPSEVASIPWFAAHPSEEPFGEGRRIVSEEAVWYRHFHRQARREPVTPKDE